MEKDVPVSRVPLEHRVMAVLSFASTKGRPRIPHTDYYRVFSHVIQQEPGFFPGLFVSEGPFSAYSKPLDSAQQQMIGSGVRLPNPGLQVLETPMDLAARNLEFLREQYGSGTIDKLEPLGAIVVEVLDRLGGQKK